MQADALRMLKVKAWRTTTPAARLAVRDVSDASRLTQPMEKGRFQRRLKGADAIGLMT